MESNTNITIRILQVSDVSQSYVDWFLDKEVTKFSDNQYKKFSLDTQISYVENCINDKDIDLYGIFDRARHIGNIVIDLSDRLHGRAEISYVIGDKKYWGKGIASKAIGLIIECAKEKYSLHKLTAGCAEKNIGSIKALQANGFSIEGTRISHLYYNNLWHDQIEMGLVLNDSKI